MKKVLKVSAFMLFLSLVGCDKIQTIIEIEKLNAVEVTEFAVEGNTLYMENLINSKTPRQLKEIFLEHPNIDTLIMGVVPGSVDDDANLEAAVWIAEKDLTIKLIRYSYIASGGTDFFLAGKKRMIEEGAQIGVHSWGGGFSTATDYEVGHEYHQPYIDYYQTIGWSKADAEKFYYFTINSASAEDIHIMSDDELKKYKVITEDIQKPAFIYLEVEEYRKEEGLKTITAEEAQARNIPIEPLPPGNESFKE